MKDHKATLSINYSLYAQALYAALSEDAFYVTMKNAIGQSHSASEAMVEYLIFFMQEAKEYGYLYIPDSHQCGASVWSTPLPISKSKQKASAKQRFISNKMGHEALITYKKMVDNMSQNSKSHVKDDCWYLSIVGLLPEFQNQGLGPGLINEVLEKTDDMGISTYLETFTPRNIRFYQRLGYNKTASFYEPTAESEYWLMTRKPNKREGKSQ